MPLRALACVNLAAIERNVARLRRELAPGVAFCAVVKADGYGHGAVPCARAALAAGASWLAVATATEAQQLRAAGLTAPVLVMGALSAEELEIALSAGADVVAWTAAFTNRLAQRRAPVRVHVKLDTGMGRLGTRERGEALAVADAILAAPDLELVGAMTHFATADDDLEFVAAQLAAFEPFVAQLRERAPGLIVHAANSAATLRAPGAHFDLVRCGIAIYGCDPMQNDPAAVGLEPALALRSYVAAVKPAAPGDSIGYGRTFIVSEPTWIATVPIGYGDGVRRGLSNNASALIGGRAYALAGTVSMDNITLQVGAPDAVAVGETVTLIGRDGPARQSAEDLARALGTINYEVVCGISARVPRAYHRDGLECES